MSETLGLILILVAAVAAIVWLVVPRRGRRRRHAVYPVPTSLSLSSAPAQPGSSQAATGTVTGK